MGIPSITTPTSDLTDYIFDGVNGLISEEATYESFEKTFERACSLSKEKIAEIHENCKKDKRLDCKYYAEPLKNYFDNLI